MITKTSLSPFKKSAGDIVPLDADAKLGIGLASPIGTLDIDTGSGGFCVTEVTLADDASVAMETILPGEIGFLWISDCSDPPDTLGEIIISGSYNTAYERMDNYGTISVSDSAPDGYLAVFPDGDSTYTMTNRRGSEKTFSLMYLGAD